MSKKCSWCDYDMVEGKAWRCPDCDELVRIDATVFHRITASPEVLAEEFCDTMFSCFDNDFRWYSMLTGEFYNSRAEAIAATVEKLKEVYNG